MTPTGGNMVPKVSPMATLQLRITRHLFQSKIASPFRACWSLFSMYERNTTFDFISVVWHMWAALLESLVSSVDTIPTRNDSTKTEL